MDEIAFAEKNIMRGLGSCICIFLLYSIYLGGLNVHIPSTGVTIFFGKYELLALAVLITGIPELICKQEIRVIRKLWKNLG